MLMVHQFNEKIKKYAQDLEEETIWTRAYLHAHPELSSQEYETVTFLKDQIKHYGLEIEDVPGSTGFTALLDTGRPGRNLGIRTDIDALPIEENENNLKGRRKYISENKGVMHACGHDGHMAIILSTIKLIHKLKEELSGKIYFIFEEGEEIGAGIDAMVAHLKDKHMDAIYGNHLAAFMDSGKISVSAGPKMAGAIFVEFTVHGKSGHGSRPDLSINPVFAAAHVLTSLTNAWANQVDVTKTVTLGLTEIHGGHAKNVIPDKVEIGGTLRFYDVEEGKRAMDIIKNVVTHTAAAHQCTVTYSDEFKLVAHPVVNDEKLASLAMEANEKIMPGSTIEDVQWFASEPFNQYKEVAPTLFAFIGARNEAYGSGAEHHNEKFDIDDGALMNGVMATSQFAVDFLMERE